MLNGGPRPMIEGVLQPVIAGMPPQHDAALAAAAGHRRHARQRPQHVIISSPQRLAGLAEQRGDVDPSEPWTGTQDRHVALLANLPRRGLRGGFDRGAEFVQPALGLFDLLIDQPQARSERADMGGRRLDRARRDRRAAAARRMRSTSRHRAANAVVLRMRAIAFSRTRAACAGVGTFSQRSRNQSAARSSLTLPACG